MCTVVVRWEPHQPAQVLALRDELTSRDFDEPDRWWPEHPDVIGGRDRTAGGTWCASRIRSGDTGLVLNRPQKRSADPGASSRGVLPLLAVTRGTQWPSYVDLAGMASFALLLVTPEALRMWTYDGADLDTRSLDPGTHMVTSGGAEDGKADRFLADFASADYPQGWRALVEGHAPQPDPTALVVRVEREGQVYGTVFGQLIEARPGVVRVEHSREPWRAGSWHAATYGGGRG